MVDENSDGVILDGPFKFKGSCMGFIVKKVKRDIEVRECFEFSKSHEGVMPSPSNECFSSSTIKICSS